MRRRASVADQTTGRSVPSARAAALFSAHWRKSFRRKIAQPAVHKRRCPLISRHGGRRCRVSASGAASDRLTTPLLKPSASAHWHARILGPLGIHLRQGAEGKLLTSTGSDKPLIGTLGTDAVSAKLVHFHSIAPSGPVGVAEGHYRADNSP